MNNSTVTKTANGLIALVLVLVPFHAFLTVWASTLFGHFTTIRLWDELILAVVTAIACFWIFREKDFRRKILSQQLMLIILAYALLNIILGIVAYYHKDVTATALGYSLIVNLRFLIWFIAVAAVAYRSSWLKKNWHKLFFYPLAIVLFFGLLQFFVLPNNFLMHFGYNDTHSLTYVDGLTLNQNSSILRVQSTLRGSNQLGAYLVVCLGLIFALFRFRNKNQWLYALPVFTVLALTFSRSAWLGMIATLTTILLIKFKPRRRHLMLAGAVLGCIVIIAIGFRNNSLEQNLLLHHSEHSTAIHTSNQGHLSALKSSINYISSHPFGGGPGSAGQASWHNKGHPIKNTESYFLQVGMETGWLGLALLAAILIAVGEQLYKLKENDMAVGLLAGLIGLVIVNMFAYGFNDDPLAYIWWGLVGIAYGTFILNSNHGSTK